MEVEVGVDSKTAAKEHQGQILGLMRRSKVHSRQLKGEEGQPLPKASSLVSQFQDGSSQILVVQGPCKEHGLCV